MTNDISIRPAYLGKTDKPDAFADTIGFARPPRISMKDDRFNVIDENNTDVSPPSLDLSVILLWENDTRVYYPKGSYDADAATPPTCFSDNPITPSVGAIQPQSVLCANCPHSVWDQPTPRGNLVPACDSRYKVACLVAGARGRIFLLSVAPASRKAYETYRRHLRAHHAKPYQVITKLGYKDKAFTFECFGWIDEATSAFVDKILETDEPALIVNAFDKPRETQALSKPVYIEPSHLQVQPAPAVEWSDKITFTGPPPKPDPQQAPVQPWLTQPAPQPAEPSPPVEEPTRRRGRPPKDAGQATSALPAASSTQGSASRGNGGGFGMEAPQTPPQNIQEALDKAFGPR